MSRAKTNPLARGDIVRRTVDGARKTYVVLSDTGYHERAEAMIACQVQTKAPPGALPVKIRVGTRHVFAMPHLVASLPLDQRVKLIGKISAGQRVAILQRLAVLIGVDELANVG